MTVTRCVAVVFMFAAIAFGQTLHLLPFQAEKNAPRAFSISIDFLRGKAPVALQWQLSVPPVIAITTTDITIGKAAQTAGESLTCTAKAEIQRRSQYYCILAGGQNPIINGPIAMVHYRVRWDTKGAPVRVSIEHILGASVNAEPIVISNVDATIDINSASADLSNSHLNH